MSNSLGGVVVWVAWVPELLDKHIPSHLHCFVATMQSSVVSASLVFRRCDVVLSLCTHSSMASLSMLVGLAASLRVGHVAVPSKCIQCCVAIMAPWKCMAKVAQLLPSSLRCGTVGGSIGKDIMIVAFLCC